MDYLNLELCSSENQLVNKKVIFKNVKCIVFFKFENTVQLFKIKRKRNNILLKQNIFQNKTKFEK